MCELAAGLGEWQCRAIIAMECHGRGPGGMFGGMLLILRLRLRSIVGGWYCRLDEAEVPSRRDECDNVCQRSRPGEEGSGRERRTGLEHIGCLPGFGCLCQNLCTEYYSVGSDLLDESPLAGLITHSTEMFTCLNRSGPNGKIRLPT